MSDEKRAKWLKKLMALGVSNDDAEDLLQNALVEAFVYLQHLHPEAAPITIESLMTDALIGRILKCRVADFFRDKKREQQLLQEYIAECHLHLPDEDAWWTFQSASEVLEHLPECWRAVVRWRVEGYSWEEIASWIGKPIGTLAPSLERALNKACKDLGYPRKKKKS
jgi:DNA-directed RNA polymerase specialized sigma24 family protein